MLSIKDAEQSMEFMYVQLGGYGCYLLKKSNSQSMDALYWFLMFNAEMVHCLDGFKEWATSNPQGGIHNEFSGARMINNSVIVTTNFPNDEETEAEIIIKKNDFIKMLDDWREIYLKLPKEVTIYFEGEQFTFDPVY